MRVRVLTAIFLTSASSVTLAKETPPPVEPTVRPNWVEVAEKGRADLLSSFYDPSSAQIIWKSGFAWGYTKPPFGRRMYGWIACGTVNAKNRLGGYVGAKGFWVFANPDGNVSSGLNDDIIRSPCETDQSTPVNPELLAISQIASPSESSVGVADELRKLAELRDKGVLTQSEFEVQKAKLLAR